MQPIEKLREPTPLSNDNKKPRSKPNPLEQEIQRLVASKLQQLNPTSAIPPVQPLNQEEFYKFTEKESKWLNEMFHRRGMGDDIQFLNLWSFDLFDFSHQISAQVLSWTSWHASFKEFILIAYGCLMGNMTVLETCRIEGGQEEVRKKLVSTKDFVKKLIELRSQGERLVKESEQFPREKWDILSAGLDLGMRLFLDKRARLIFLDKQINKQTDKFNNINFLCKTNIEENIQELIKYLTFIDELIKHTVKHHEGSISSEGLIEKARALIKQPYQLSSFQEFRQVSMDSIIRCIEYIDILTSSRKDKEGCYYFKFLVGDFIRTALFQAHFFYGRSANLALPNTYLVDDELQNRIEDSFQVLPEAGEDDYLTIMQPFFDEWSQLGDNVSIVLALRKGMKLVVEELIIESTETPSLLQTSKKSLEKFFELREQFINFLKVDNAQILPKSSAYFFLYARDILDTINPDKYDFNQFEIRITKHFYRTFRKLPISFIVKNRGKLLEFAKTLVIFSLKHVATMLQAKEDMLHLFGRSERRRSLQDLLPDGFADCVKMRRLKKQLDKWIKKEAALVSPEAVGAPAPSLSLSSVLEGVVSSPDAVPLPVVAPPPLLSSPAAESPEIFIPLPPCSVIPRPKIVPKPKQQPSPASGPADASRSNEEQPIDDLCRRNIRRRKLVAALARYGISDAIEKRRGGGSHEKFRYEGGSGSVIIPRHTQFNIKTLFGIIDQVKALKEAHRA